MTYLSKKKFTINLPLKNAFDDPSSIGNILVSLGCISRNDLHSAVDQQAHFNDAVLGALLCQRGVTTNEDIAKALLIQQKMRNGDMLAAELDVLETRLSECQDSGRELQCAINKKKTTSHKHGKNYWPFLVTAASAKA